jgi:hypothetical protein
MNGSINSRIAHLHQRLIEMQGSEESNWGDQVTFVRRELQGLTERADLHWRQSQIRVVEKRGS